MRQLVFARRNLLEWRETESPRLIGPDQALVRPLAIARCDLDIPIVTGNTLFRPPFPVGHEFVGVLTDLSDDLRDTFFVGQKVAVPFQVSCGSCGHCLKHLSRSCSEVAGSSDYGMGPGARRHGGAVAERVLVPHARQMLLPLPDSADAVALASLSDNIAEAWKMAGFYLASNPNTPVLVVGGIASSIGLYTVGLARAMGAPEVVYLDQSEERLRVAASYGAAVQQIGSFPRSHSRTFPLIVDATGTPEGYRFCVRSVTEGGICTSSSIFFQNDFPLPFLDLYVRGVTLHIERVNSREMMPRVLEWINSGDFDAGRVVSQVVDFEDAREAWVEPSTKLVVRGPAAQ